MSGDSFNGINHLTDDGARIALTFDRYLEDRFLGLGAHPLIPAGMLSNRMLEKIDYFRNFPHLATGTYTYDESEKRSLADCTAGPAQAEPSMWGTEFLPSATCYSIFDHLADTQLPLGSLYTAIGRCFRTENHYEKSRRNRSFLMRELVYVGSTPGADEFRSSAEIIVKEIGDRLGLSLSKAPANDPFYEQSSRAFMTQLNPVKFEFSTADGMAIASVNKHRTFFGDRLNITATDGAAITSSCLAFGIDRWVAALTDRWGPEEALRAVKRILMEDCVRPFP